MLRRVLLVEDDRHGALAMHAFLAMDGMTVDVVSTLQEALSALGQVAYDAVVTDLHLPGVGSGQDLANRLRGTRLILLSADTSGIERATGFDAVLRKPCSPGALVRAIVGAAAPVGGGVR
jgi:DNA-binding response OmpR family regulator